MEAEIREILTDAVREPGETLGLVEALRQRFSALGGVDLDLPPRSARPRAADLS
jgi:plasmid stability protein